MWQDSLGKILGPKWEDVPQAVRDIALAKVGSWMDTEESEYADIIMDALADKTPPLPVLAQLLATVIEHRAKPDDPLAPFVQRLLRDLDDGKITTKELAEVAAVWVNGHVTSPDLQSFVVLATTLPFEDGDIKEGILAWVHDRAGAALDADLRDAIDNRKALTTRDLALFLISALAQSKVFTTGHVDASGLKSALLEALESASATAKLGPIIGIIKAFLADKPAEAVLIAVRYFGFVGDDSFVKALLGITDLKAEIFKRLANVVSGLGVPKAQAQALVTRFFEIAEGKAVLFTEHDERAEMDAITDVGYGLWLELRRVLFATKLAVAGGAVVPTDAMARPYVFAAADINWKKTRVKELAGSNLPLFCTLATEFSAVQFGRFGKDLTDPPLFTPDMIKAANPLVSDFFRANLIPRLDV